MFFWILPSFCLPSLSTTLGFSGFSRTPFLFRFSLDSPLLLFAFPWYHARIFRVPFWAILGRWALLCHFGAVLGHLRATLGLSWAILEPSLGHLGPSWRHPGPFWGHSGSAFHIGIRSVWWFRFWTVVVLVLLGPMLELPLPSSAVLGHLGAILVPS